jgi:hypothetical protein
VARLEGFKEAESVGGIVVNLPNGQNQIERGEENKTRKSKRRHFIERELLHKSLF